MNIRRFFSWFCLHDFIRADAHLQIGMSRGLRTWKCTRCGKSIVKDWSWIPLSEEG